MKIKNHIFLNEKVDEYFHLKSFNNEKKLF